MKLLYPLAKRFIAGHDINSMLENIAYYDLVTINYVGESATTPCIAEANLKEYKALINALKSLSHREYEISLKLTQFGMTPTEWKDPVTELTDQVKDIPFIKLKFDMEKESLIDDTLKFSRCFDDVGIVLQANMQRSYFDIDKAMESYTRVRICKGAYKGNIRNMDDIRKNYLNIVEEIFKSGYFYHKDYKQDFIALGTHDEYLIENIKKLSRQYGGKQKFYFEMLFGIRRDLAKRLIGEGYSVRTYIPYGADWMPYVIRRLSEFKNLKFVGVNIIKELFSR
jgi:proline dehydrogenase